VEPSGAAALDTHLTDLDSIILTVRDQRAREYISEAIAAYRAGAYKASILSVWVAITFDILTKIREIAQTGDGAATDFISRFDAAANNHNVSALLTLENELLDKALNPFGFIGYQELIHLQRLREDRHLCAHPSFTADAELFQPSPDLVRVHIVHAVQMLLANAAVQGKKIITVFALGVGGFSAGSRANVPLLVNKVHPTNAPWRSFELCNGAAKGLFAP
jgi:hypothetical protein